MPPRSTRYSPFMQAVQADDSLPIDRAAVDLWLKDAHNPLRWVVRPLLQFVFSMLLYVIWTLKRLPLPQFRAHRLLQRTICWFCRNFVSPEANLLILRHFATESNLLNFLRDNSNAADVRPLALYPHTIDGLLEDSFVRHDQELFRMFQELGGDRAAHAPATLVWTHWRPITLSLEDMPRRATQVLDFETSHALFMCLFCLLLTAEEYRDSINGFNLDQSIAIRIGRLIGDPTLAEYAYNKYPLYPVGPGNLGQRFLMHGFFTEHLHARLEQLRGAS
ncbi:MAG TPA: hypothetical protein VFU13_20380 [Steroidobacteraceae bacterium]|nr:hypothetical protein [Steroidobacteraceae bacterium]